MRAWWMVLLVAACDDTDGPSVAADAAVDVTVIDAPLYQCVPPDPLAPGPTCLALESATFEGTTPLGVHSTSLQYVGAGDCITHSQVWIEFAGACGEHVRLSFSYPAMSGPDSKRFIASGSFDRLARLDLEAPGASTTTTANIHVEVVEWQEGDGVHDIDITVTLPDAGYAVAPIHVKGTFCDWAYQLC